MRATFARRAGVDVRWWQATLCLSADMDLLLDILLLELLALAGIAALWLCLGLIEWVYAHVVQWISVLIHELGHGIPALAAGKSVTVVVGRDDGLIRFRLGRVAFRLDPRLEVAYCDYGEWVAARRTAVFVTLGGPFASLLQMLAAATAAYQLRDSVPLALVSLLFVIGGAAGVAQLLSFGESEGVRWKGWLRMTDGPGDGAALRAILRPDPRPVPDVKPTPPEWQDRLRRVRQWSDRA
jgi:hypothetical protein